MSTRLVAAVALLSLGLSATARAELSPAPQADKPAPRVIETTGSYANDARPVPAPQPQQAAVTAPAPTAKPAVAERTVRTAQVRTAKYSGGEGSTWKTGRNAYGFMGTYGGCRYSGHAGPNGYTLDRVCR
ncbi:translation initiation factor IF-2 [Methylobacterium sp. sgz302541]|uniref:translation initiation factor IF-2 n=1 Tax=unclassified Methylobacterium TaxID=2615210 RepID=UPI003D34E17F